MRRGDGDGLDGAGDVGGIDDPGVEFPRRHLGQQGPDVGLQAVGGGGDARGGQGLAGVAAAGDLFGAEADEPAGVGEVLEAGDAPRVAGGDGDHHPVAGEDPGLAGQRPGGGQPVHVVGARRGEHVGRGPGEDLLAQRRRSGEVEGDGHAGVPGLEGGGQRLEGVGQGGGGEDGEGVVRRRPAAGGREQAQGHQGRRGDAFGRHEAPLGPDVSLRLDRTGSDVAGWAAMDAPRLSLTEWAVLAVLAERPAHPFAVARLLGEDGELGRVLTVRRPLVYRAAERLAAAGLCRPDHTEPGEGGPERTVYRATPAGRRALAKWLAEPVTRVRDLRLEFLLKVRLTRRAGELSAGAGAGATGGAGPSPRALCPPAGRATRWPCGGGTAPGRPRLSWRSWRGGGASEPPGAAADGVHPLGGSGVVGSTPLLKEATLAARLEVTREQILAFRRRVGGLDARLPPGRRSLREAAWAGLKDSMPRAAVLSLHARVSGIGPAAWEDPALVQLWGPGYHAYVVAAGDVGVFTLGRLPDDGSTRRVAEDLAARLRGLLGETRMTYSRAGRALGESPNRLRYATLTGTVLLRWDGARQPVIWTVPPPEIEPGEARLELARRYLRVFGPGTAEGFARWAGISPAAGRGGLRRARQVADPGSHPDRGGLGARP